MKRYAGWLFSSLGYLLYTILVLVVLLWVLFPADSVRVWLQARMNSPDAGLRWEISGLHKAWPVSVVATGVRLRESATAPEPIFQIDELKIMPDFGKILEAGKSIPVRYHARALAGTVRGTGELNREDGMVRCGGDVEKIALDQLGELWRKMNREAAGSLSGRFSFEGPWRDAPRGGGKADLTVTNGFIDLYQPLFGLSQLEFSRMTAALHLRDRIVTLEEGTIESKLLAGEYSGTVTLTDPLIASKVEVEGLMEPRPELLGNIRDGAVLALIRNQLQENRLSFAISGTILEPGITFHGASGVIDGIIQGSAR